MSNPFAGLFSTPVETKEAKIQATNLGIKLEALTEKGVRKELTDADLDEISMLLSEFYSICDEHRLSCRMFLNDCSCLGYLKVLTETEDELLEKLTPIIGQAREGQVYSTC